jgi:hypothetical protein
MEKKIILGTLALIAVAISLLLMLPDNSVNTPETLPWNITHPTPESTRVFGITLGTTTLNDLSKSFKYEAEIEISLFKPSDSMMSVEAFIEEVNFNGLKAKMVLTIGVPHSELQGMYERGLRMSSAPSGKRITLTFDDLARVRATSVASLTYLPNVRIEPAIISKRFGEPAQRIREKKSGVTHWLYPQHGLDVALSDSAKPVLQYLSPKDFELLSAPLLADGEIVK